MKIIRDSVEYELTSAEMREAYEIMKNKYLKCDVECKAEEMEVELSDSAIEYAANRVDKVLGNNDSYWESYWMTIENVINEQIEV